MPTIFEWLKLALQYECPKCGAQVKRECTGPRGEYKMPHDERIEFMRNYSRILALKNPGESAIDAYNRLYLIQEDP